MNIESIQTTLSHNDICELLFETNNTLFISNFAKTLSTNQLNALICTSYETMYYGGKLTVKRTKTSAILNLFSTPEELSIESILKIFKEKTDSEACLNELRYIKGGMEHRIKNTIEANFYAFKDAYYEARQTHDYDYCLDGEYKDLMVELAQRYNEHHFAADIYVHSRDSMKAIDIYTKLGEHEKVIELAAKRNLYVPTNEEAVFQYFQRNPEQLFEMSHTNIAFKEFHQAKFFVNAAYLNQTSDTSKSRPLPKMSERLIRIMKDFCDNNPHGYVRAMQKKDEFSVADLSKYVEKVYFDTVLANQPKQEAPRKVRKI